MSRNLEGIVVVVTGASSGIGRAAALAFAEQGCDLVLAARRARALEEVARQCRSRGVAAVAAPTDVTSPEAVEDLARHAAESFGRIDVWVNNAAVTLFARFEEAPMDAYRQVIETNLFGVIHGSRAALRRFRERGRGVLVNVASVVAHVGQPYTSAYVASKFAIRGLGECLRQELGDAPGIHVCTVLPPSVDTPLFQQAANYTGRAVRPLSPVHDPAEVAAAIVRAARAPRREIFVDLAGRVLPLAKALAPGPVERAAGRKVERGHFSTEAAPISAGNLFEPLPQWASLRGGWRGGGARGPSRALLGLGLALVALPLTAGGLRLLIARRAAQ
jgi:short-subunit dehydrogenase